MRKVINSDGHQVGQFDGNTVRDSKGKIVYWILDDGDVFSPFEYEGSDLQIFNKGQSNCIGKYIGNQCFNGDEFVFEII